MSVCLDACSCVCIFCFVQSVRFFLVRSFVHFDSLTLAHILLNVYFSCLRSHICASVKYRNDGIGCGVINFNYAKGSCDFDTPSIFMIILFLLLHFLCSLHLLINWSPKAACTHAFAPYIYVHECTKVHNCHIRLFNFRIRFSIRAAACWIDPGTLARWFMIQRVITFHSAISALNNYDLSLVVSRNDGCHYRHPKFLSKTKTILFLKSDNVEWCPWYEAISRSKRS